MKFLRAALAVFVPAFVVAQPQSVAPHTEQRQTRTYLLETSWTDF
jgi:hypothetical protein